MFDNSKAVIAIKNINGEIDYIITILDGELTYTGFMLYRFYNDCKLVEKLISIGDLNYLGHDIFNCSFSPNISMFVETKYAESTKMLMERFKDSHFKYFYLFDDNEWYYCEKNSSEYENFTLVKDIIEDKMKNYDQSYQAFLQKTNDTHLSNQLDIISTVGVIYTNLKLVEKCIKSLNGEHLNNKLDENIKKDLYDKSSTISYILGDMNLKFNNAILSLGEEK